MPSILSMKRMVWISSTLHQNEYFLENAKMFWFHKEVISSWYLKTGFKLAKLISHVGMFRMEDFLLPSQETSSFTAAMEELVGYQLEQKTSCSMDSPESMCVTRALSSCGSKVEPLSGWSQLMDKYSSTLISTTVFLAMGRL